MTRRWTHRLRDDEGGWALVTALILLALMMIVGTATLAYSNGQSSVSGRERLNESAFNLGEGALNVQTTLLSQQWQGKAMTTTTQMPTSCTSTATDPRCPKPSELTSSFTSPDYSSAPAWATSVRDDAGGSATTCSASYSSAVDSGPRYDANNNGCLWVRANATVSGRTRTMIGLVRVDRVIEQIPKATVVAGSIQILNSGNKPMVCISLPQGDPASAKDCDGTGTSGPVLLRCPKTSSSCYDSSKPDVQISPGGVNAITFGYQQTTGLSADALARLKARADADGTHYPSCPTSPPPAGAVVYVDSGNNCDLSNNRNTPTSPGMFIVERGTMSIGSNGEYDGIVYAMNLQNSSGTVVTGGGNSIIRGGVFVDGLGKFSVGESKINLVFDPYAFTAVQSYGTARLVQNRWQEIAP